jgi:sigma-E factor negative regulatory protein RseB
MNPVLRHARLPTFIVFLLSSSTAFAAGLSARDWMMSMAEAVQKHNYEGTFVYRHGDQIESMRIVHRVDRGRQQERLIALNGVPREIVRNDHDVICYLPDRNSVMVEQRKNIDQNFPAMLPKRLARVTANYKLALGGTNRIADRMAQMVIVRPEDQYRYGYHLWADTKTGLLLKSNLVDPEGHIIEQFMFTNIAVDKPISNKELKPRYSGKGMVWHRETDTPAKSVSGARWGASKLPPGFVLTKQIARQGPMHKQEVEHLVYSDGLAAVSVFIEPKDPNKKGAIVGATSMGAVHAFGRQVGKYHVTAIGEVPAATVAMIANSVALTKDGK